jgi:hypothetical protein
MKFVGFRDSVVVNVPPQTKLVKYRIPTINQPVAISTVRLLVEFCQRKKAILFDQQVAEEVAK